MPQKSEIILKRIDQALSTLHFTIWLPVLITVGVGLVAIPFSIAEIDFVTKIGIVVAGVIFVSLFAYVELETVHHKQDFLWDLYTFVSLYSEKFDALDYKSLNDFQKVIADIQRSYPGQKKYCEKLVVDAKRKIR